MLGHKHTGGGTTRSAAADDGATVVEFALIFPILLLFIFGIAEFGLAFKDFLAVSNATREGARIASSAGNNDDADCAIVRGLNDSLTALTLDNVQRVEIFKGIPGGGQDYANTNTWTYSSGDPMDCSSWNKSGSWASISRNTTVGSTPLDIIGVKVVYRHDWISGFGPFSGSWTLDRSTITRLEPEAFE